MSPQAAFLPRPYDRQPTPSVRHPRKGTAEETAAEGAETFAMVWNIQERQSGPVTVLELSGRLTLGEGSDSLDAKLQELIAAGRRAVLLDCRRVDAIDSRGIKTLVRAHTSMERAGGRLKLLQPRSRVRQVLEMTHLLTVIEAFDDEPQALDSFGS